jgi:GNAT superfamily N-acetyltransferase
MTVRIRPAVPADAEQLAEVHVRSWQAAYRGMLPDEFLERLEVDGRVEPWRKRLGRQQAPTTTTVAVSAGRLIGFASVCPSRDDDLDPGDWLELNTIYLMPSAWGTGVGSRLLAAALAENRQYFLWVLTANHRARAFYRKAGFVPDGAARPITIETTTLQEIRYRRSGLTRSWLNLPARPDPSGAD